MYLEIGVAKNDVFNSIPLSLNNKIGVDPFSGGTHRMTSDNFFKINKKKFDVIFIDGLHTYKQCQKDLINSVKFLNDDGIIIFHDFLPRNSIEGSAVRKNKDWCGDIWKVAVEINQSIRKEFVIVNIDMGVGLLKPKKKFIYKKNNELKNKNFDNFIKEYKKQLPVVNSEKGLNFI
jgi:tRNA G37 N-methylase Trm5